MAAPKYVANVRSPPGLIKPTALPVGRSSSFIIKEIPRLNMSFLNNNPSSSRPIAPTNPQSTSSPAIPLIAFATEPPVAILILRCEISF